MKTNNPNSLIVTQADNCAANHSASKQALFAVLLLNRWVGNNRCASQTFKKLASPLPLSLMLMQVQIPPAQAAPLIQQCSNITFREDATLPASPYDITVGDFNSDGKQDLVGINYRDDTVSVLLGNGNGTFQKQATFAVGSYHSFLTVGDFNGDGKQDLVTASGGSSKNVSVLLGNGNGTFQEQATFAVNYYTSSVTVGDFNGDGKQDLVITYYLDNNVSVLLGNGNGTFQKQATFAVNYYPYDITVGDFNGDGNQDLATANRHSNNANNVSVLLGNGNGTFQKQATFAVGSYPNDITVGDFNSDGKQDLVTTSYSPNNVSVLLGNGNGTFQKQATVAVKYYLSSVTIGDFNGDGNQDLVGENDSFNIVSVLLGNGNGTFQEQAAFALSGFAPTSLTAGIIHSRSKNSLSIS